MSIARTVVADEQADVAIDAGAWGRFTTSVVDALHVGTMEVGLHFVDRTTMADLKVEHLGGDGAPTDVLAFPLDDPHPGEASPDGGPLILGDIVLCPAVAQEQAPSHAGSLDDEIALLVVHAALHLVGHDHVEDAERDAMQAEERRLLGALWRPLTADPWAAVEQDPR